MVKSLVMSLSQTQSLEAKLVKFLHIRVKKIPTSDCQTLNVLVSGYCLDIGPGLQWTESC